jgi:hypothetical protein
MRCEYASRTWKDLPHEPGGRIGFLIIKLGERKQIQILLSRDRIHSFSFHFLFFNFYHLRNVFPMVKMLSLINCSCVCQYSYACHFRRVPVNLIKLSAHAAMSVTSRKNFPATVEYIFSQFERSACLFHTLWVELVAVEVWPQSGPRVVVTPVIDSFPRH